MAQDDQTDAHSSEAAGETVTPETLSRAGGTGVQLELGNLAIDRRGEIPIGVQLAWALRARIGDGRLLPGQRLPGLREIAEMLGINANTARAVYQRLEQEGLIDSRQGTGTFVASVAQEPSAVGRIAADAARQAHRTGVDPREVAAALYVAGGPSLDRDAHADEPLLADEREQEGERRRELRAQIAALEQALSELQTSHPGLIPTPAKPLRQAGPRLLSVEELERVRIGLVRRLASAEPALEADAKQTKAKAQERRPATDAEERSALPRQDKPAQERKAPRPRARTRPSTA